MFLCRCEVEGDGGQSSEVDISHLHGALGVVRSVLRCDLLVFLLLGVGFTEQDLAITRWMWSSESSSELFCEPRASCSGR